MCQSSWGVNQHRAAGWLEHKSLQKRQALVSKSPELTLETGLLRVPECRAWHTGSLTAVQVRTDGGFQRAAVGQAAHAREQCSIKFDLVLKVEGDGAD